MATHKITWYRVLLALILLYASLLRFEALTLKWGLIKGPGWSQEGQRQLQAIKLIVPEDKVKRLQQVTIQLDLSRGLLEASHEPRREAPGLGVQPRAFRLGHDVVWRGLRFAGFFAVARVAAAFDARGAPSAARARTNSRSEARFSQGSIGSHSGEPEGGEEYGSTGECRSENPSVAHGGPFEKNGDNCSGVGRRTA